MAHYNFYLDKKDGDKAEEMVLAYIQQMFPKAYRIPGKEVRYDIIVPELSISLEVKNDKYFSKSGNLCFETHKQSGELSGILATEADYWVHILDGKMHIAPRESLKQYVINGGFRGVWGGDRKATFMYLVPFTKLQTEPWFHKVGDDE
jgi:hypothetical protein